MPEKVKKRIIPDKTPMREQDPSVRVGNFDEVSLGYSEEDALREASRCLDCKKPGCIQGCPVSVDIPAFIRAIRSRDFEGAIDIIKDRNVLPAVCGRVCPQENQCEKFCIVGRKNDPVGIGRLERFVADRKLIDSTQETPEIQPATGKRVAVVGSGPSGLTCAYDLARQGHEVAIYEAFHEPGGVLVYGIPEFRLPKTIVAKEIETLRQMGVEIVLNAVVGKLLTVDELFENFDACFIGTGAGLPRFMDIEGENLNGVYSANEFLTRVNLMRAYDFPDFDTPVRRGQRVAVVGGGNVAMDSVRTALRLGAKEACIVYRRSEEEMPARREEIHHAREEGVRFELLSNPVRILGRDGFVTEIECLRMKLSEPDDSGRRRPTPVDGSEFRLPVDVVIMAIGSGANPLVPQSTADLSLTGRGYIEAEEQTGKTSRKGVFAGGDIVTGSATVISAMGAGRRAAASIHEYLISSGRPRENTPAGK